VETNVESRRSRIAAGGRARAHGRRVQLLGLASGFAPFLIAFGVYLAVYLAMQPGTTGDEQHYLITARSLVLDGDLDLANDYASRERTLAVANSFPQAPHAFRYGDSDALVTWHGLALSIVLAPFVAIGGVEGARIAMILVAAILAQQLLGLLRQLGIARAAFRWLAWAAVVACLPVLVFSNQIYPEVPAALLVVVALRVILTPRPPPRAYLLAALAGAALPWLNMRYLPLAVGVFLGLTYVACRPVPAMTTGASGGGTVARAWSAARGCAGTLSSARRDVGAAIVLPFAVSSGTLAGVFQALYGSPLPDAPYRPGGATIGSGGWDFWYHTLLADFLHPSIGWIPYVPVHWLGLAAIGCLVWRFRGHALAVLTVLAVHVLLVASIAINIGLSFPGRYLLVVIPLVAIPLALVLESVRTARLAFFPLLFGSLVFAAAAVLNHGSLFPMPLDRTTPARLAGVRSIQTAFPDTALTPAPRSFVLRPADSPPQVGRMERGRVIASRRRADPPGFLLFGPYTILGSGLYWATFSLDADGTRGDPVVTRVEVVATPERVLAQRLLRASELDEGPGLTPVILSFATPGGVPIETRVHFEGRGTLVAGPIEVTPEPGTQTPTERFPDWPLAFLWVVGTVVIGALFVEVVRRPD
jgi:hypothetical protein